MALDQGLSNSFPFYDALGQVSQEELSQAVNRASSEDGKLGLNPQAFDELLGGLPISGIAGTTERVFNKAVNSSTRNVAGHARYLGELSAIQRQDYLNELTANQIKHTPENIVDIRRMPDGRLAFLEAGSSNGGLVHIIEEHGQHFSDVGIHADQVPDAIMTAVTRGNIIGYQGKGAGRPVYDFVFNDTRHRMAVTIGDNGFIVGANPKPRPGAY